MKHFSSGLLLLLTLTASAQSVDWLQPVPVIYPQNGDLSSVAMTADNNGTVALLGPTGTIQSYGSEVFGDLSLQLIDAAGNLSASALFIGAGAAKELVADNGSFFAIGRFKDSLQVTGHPTLTVFGVDPTASFLCRFEADGTVTWVHRMADLGISGHASALSVGPGGVLYVAAWDYTNSVIVQVDQLGMLLDTWTQSGVAVVSSMDVNASGTVALAGSCLSPTADFNGTIVNAPNNYTVFAARYSSTGLLQDHLIVEDITCPFPSVVLDDANNLYFAADAFISTPFGPFMIQDAAWVYGTYIAKIDAMGVVQWLKQPSPGMPLGDVARGTGKDLVLHPDGGIWLGGSARGANDWGDGISTSAAIPGNSLFFWHVDAQGFSQQVITGDQPDLLQTTHSLAAVGPDVLYVLGSGYDTLELGGLTMPAQGHHLFLSKWSGLSTGLLDREQELTLKAFPNPATDHVLIDLSELNGPVQLEVLDAQGRMVLNASGSANTIQRLDVSVLQPGFYVVSARTGALTRSLRFVKQ